MRLILLFLFFLFIPVTVSAVEFTVEDNIIVGDVSYGFSSNLEFKEFWFNKSCISFEGVVFCINPPGHMNVTINSVEDKTNYDFSYIVDDVGIVYFNIAGRSFTREYMGDVDYVVLKDNGVDNTNDVVNNTMSAYSNVIDILQIMIIVVIFIVPISLILMLRGI